MNMFSVLRNVIKVKRDLNEHLISPHFHPFCYKIRFSMWKIMMHWSREIPEPIASLSTSNIFSYVVFLGITKNVNAVYEAISELIVIFNLSQNHETMKLQTSNISCLIISITNYNYARFQDQ